MKPGDLIKTAPSTSPLLDGQLGVLITEPGAPESVGVDGGQWKVILMDGNVYWLYPDTFEVQE